MEAVLGGRTVTLTALHRLLGEHADASAFVELFGRELDAYAELIVGPGGVPAGFMTRGEDRNFTARAQGALAQLGMPDHALAHHAALASWFEHLRGFLKLEWHVSADGVEPLAACYFRRRPSVADALARLADLGVSDQPLALARDVAELVDKRTVHFVSAAFRPTSPVHHKLYFSQWVTPNTRAKVEANILRVFERYGFGEDMKQYFRARHDPCLRQREQTIFVSLSFSADEAAPSFKVDYPDVRIDAAATWLDAASAESVATDAGHACQLAGVPRLSFLGVRFHPERSRPSLKYYCDVPRNPFILMP